MTSTPPPRPDLPAQFVPGEVEAGLYERWVERGYFEADPKSGRPPFSIVIPPPNVTGSLHLGHAMDHTLIDVLTRRRRMQGHDALYLPGMDHAGIATQSVVERRLAEQGRPGRRAMGREAFVRCVWEWKAESGGAILGQMRRLGEGVDWTRERFTLDDGLSRAVRTIFKQMFDEGLIYRAERLVNWSPALQSAISDIEVDHKEVDGELVSICYGSLEEGADDSVVVATTRVETMLGDTAVAVHPDDERYRHLVGRTLRMPITGRDIPVIADPYVDPAFGTGALKITPAHDPNDFEMGRRHGLPMPTVLDEAGVVTGTGTRFDGMDRFAAREAVREELRAQGRIVDERRPYRHSVGHDSRTGVVVEPRLSLQWFVRVESLARASGDAVRSGATTIHPPELSSRFFDWVDNMHDWCISRQLWWGHRIPVWYGPDGETVCVGPDEEPPAGWRQDDDVLDTWFSSALWPFSTLGWPEQTPDLERYYPTSVLVTGYDILFFWVVRMMMFGTYAMGEAPFRDVYLHGLIRDEHGRKMSKSKGNVIDPLDLLDAYGADALRFTIARGSNPGTDMSLSDEWVAGSRNFTTKLWNATRFALANGASAALPLPAEADRTDADRWILGRLREVHEQTDALLEDYQFAKATEGLYHFTWDELCDWYVELAKVQLRDDATAPGTRAVLGHVLDALLRLLAPITPFVTEVLWTALTGEESVVVAPWPVDVGAAPDAAAAARLADLQKLVTEVRRFRTEQGLPDSRRVAASVTGPLGAPGAEAALRALARLDAPGEGFAATATVDVALSGGPAHVEIDTSGAIDVAAERARLGRDLAAATKELEQAEKKLGNPKFVEKAPAAVVEGIRTRREAAAADIERVTARLAALPSGTGPSGTGPSGTGPSGIGPA